MKYSEAFYLELLETYLKMSQDMCTKISKLENSNVEEKNLNLIIYRIRACIEDFKYLTKENI